MNFKTAKILIARHEIHDYVLKLWKTELFRNLHYYGICSRPDRQHNFVSSIVERFADMPRFFFDMTDKVNEHAHFSTWWGGIPHREYDNPYIHDLYLIHEMAHAGEMVYLEGMNFDNFLRKMTDNELHASVVSEIQVYLEIPKLRKLSFKHPIYADRFLEDERFMRRYRIDKERAFEEMKVRRRNTMMDTNATDTADKWIHRFYNQNAAWGAVWAHNYNKVEAAMARLREHSYINREAAMKAFMVWLAQNTTHYEVPFYREAQAFAGVYWANRGHYDDAMKEI